MMSLNKIVASNIRRLRQTRGLTQSELAEAADLTLPGVQAVEYGRSSVSVDSVARIAQALRSTPAELFLMPGEKLPHALDNYDDLAHLLSRETIPLPIGASLLELFHVATPAQRVFVFALLLNRPDLAIAVLKDIDFLKELKKAR